MTPYTDQELEQMLLEVESDLVERKESFAGDTPTKAREAVCGFANDLPGHGRPGVIFLGVRDSGSPSGLVVTDELLLNLAAMKSDGNIVPPPTLTVAKRTIAGQELAVVSVKCPLPSFKNNLVPPPNAFTSRSRSPSPSTSANTAPVEVCPRHSTPAI